MSGLRYRVFPLFNAKRALVWGIGYTLLCYIVGLSFQRILTPVGLRPIAVQASCLSPSSSACC